METTRKIKTTANVLFLVVSLVLLWFIVITAWGGFRYAVPVGESPHPGRVLVDIVRVLVLLSILICALTVLLAIRKDETPFNVKNVRLLKRIAILLMVVEPYEVFAGWITSLFSSPRIMTLYLPAGCVFAAGLVVYCVSLVFDYGISLQKQIDETL